MAEPLTDAILLDRFVTGREEAAFAELVRRYHVRVRSVCRGVLGNDQDADDVVQATFLTLALKAGEHSYSWRESIGGWLCLVAKRLARDARGSASRRRRREVASEELPEPQARHGDPSRECDRRELSRLVRQELNRLPEKYREPVVLCDLEGLSHAEAADRLGLPSGSMSRRLGKARSILRQRLSGQLMPLASLLLAVSLVGVGLSRRLVERDGLSRSPSPYRLALGDLAAVRQAALTFEGHAGNTLLPDPAFLEAREELRLATAELGLASRAGDLASLQLAARRLDATCLRCHPMASQD